MEKLEGIDLSQVAEEAEREVLLEQQAKVRAMVGGIVMDIAKWRRELNDNEKAQAKLNDKIAAAEAKYKRIREGDWSVLNENMLKNQPSAEKAT